METDLALGSFYNVHAVKATWWKKMASPEITSVNASRN